MFDLVNTVVAARREREYAPTLAALQRVAMEAETDKTHLDVRERIAVTLKTI